MQNDILFDNIYIGHSVADAERLQKETFDIKKEIEDKLQGAEKPKADPNVAKSPMDLKFMDDPVLFIKEKWELFATIAKTDPIGAARFVPEIAGGLAVIFITFVGLLLGALGGGAAAAPSKEQIKAKATEVKNKAIETKDKVVEKVEEVAEKVTEAVTSGVETVQDETKKRTTRSSSAHPQ